MNPISPQWMRWLLVCLCVLLLVPVFAIPAHAGAESSLFANAIWDFASDRTRMIQISLVIVTFGIAIMWWYR